MKSVSCILAMSVDGLIFFFFFTFQQLLGSTELLPSRPCVLMLFQGCQRFGGTG